MLNYNAEFCVDFVKASMKKSIVFFYLVFLLMSCSNEWRDFIRAGNKSYENGNFIEAKDIYKSAVDAKPDEPIANYNLGVALHQNREFYLAEESFLKSISQLNFEQQSKAYYNLGNSQFQAGNFGDSVRSYKSALRLDHKDSDSRHNLELALEKLGQQQQNREAPSSQSQANSENRVGDQNQRSQQQQNLGKSPPLNPIEQRMSKADAIRLLKSLKNDEHEIRKQILLHQIVRQPSSIFSKDW